MSENTINYDVAFSFAGEDRAYVEEVASELSSMGFRVFYDKYEAATLWGKNLYTHLQKVYSQQARYTVIFISKHYKEKLWTNHERESAQARAFSERSEYILPARFDDTEIPGILPTTAYINLSEYGPKQLAELIREKIGPTENRHPELNNLIQEYLRARVSRLEENRRNYPKDLHRNLLDFYIEPIGSSEPPPKDKSDSGPGALLWELMTPSLKKNKPCIILAEFGTGKTWLLETICFRLATNYIASTGGNGKGWIPLFTKLRDFHREVIPAGFLGVMGSLLAAKPTSILDQLRDQAWAAAIGESNLRANKEVLVQLLEEGRFLFLFDALDEMVMGSRDEVNTVVTELGKISEHTRTSPLVVTCRRSFFRDPAQEKSLRERGFEVFYMWPWAGSNILEYLAKAHAAGILKMKPEDAIKKIEGVHDLRDIASRALLSAMLVDQWEAFMRDEAVDVPSLYERYIEKAILSWQSERARQVEMHDLRRYMEELAFLMFRMNSLSISPEELDEYFSGKFKEFGITKFSSVAESLVRDIKTNSFLLREDNNYVFCHASIWEFFVGRKLCRALEQGDQSAFGVRSRAPQYRSIITNFLVPMLKKQNMYHLIPTLMRQV